jgi:hypothetical protein
MLKSNPNTAPKIIAKITQPKTGTPPTILLSSVPTNLSNTPAIMPKQPLTIAEAIVRRIARMIASSSPKTLRT